jgi:hypothetical protein
LVRSETAITAANVDEFRAEPATIAIAEAELRRQGFNVSGPGVTLTITGPQTLFEKTFQIKLSVEQDAATRRMIVRPSGEVVIPASLQSAVEAVVFPEPPEYFA